MKKLFLVISLIYSCLTLVAQSPPPPDAFSFDARILPALYKAKSGQTRKMEVTVNYPGKPAAVTVFFGNQSYLEKMVTGKNTFTLEFPEVSVPQRLKLSLAYNKERYSREIEVKPVRRWRMNFVQHSHTDIGYTRSQTEILAEHLRYIDYALDYCDATDDYPDFARFRWVCEISWAVSEYLKSRPAEQIERLKKRVAEGRIELAAMYLNFDELPDEQTLAASLYPLKQFRETGLKTEVAMQDDVNGIGWCFSEYFSDLGVKYINMGTHGYRALICFPYPTVFWWESPSGRKILTYRAEHYMQGNFFGIHADDFAGFESNVLNYLDKMEAAGYPFDLLVAQHSGYYTDNSPPSIKACEMLKRWNEKYEWPKLRTAVAGEFFREVETEYADQLQTIRGAWPDWWTDGFASGAREAAVSRISHANIIASQAGFSFAKMLGAEFTSEEKNQIDEINKALLFYDEHTFGYHASVGDPYGSETWEQRSLKQSYAWEAYRRSGLLKEIALGLLQEYVPRQETPSILVFNPLNWAYDGLATVYIDHQILPDDREFEITDYQGNTVPAQVGQNFSDGAYWSVYVKNLPPLGYAQYYIRVKDAPAPKQEEMKELKQTHIENQWYAVDFNPDKGSISRLFDKELNQPLLTPGATWEMGELIHETLPERRMLEIGHVEQKLSVKPEFTRRPPEKMRFERYEKGDVWDSYCFVGETAAGREADNLRVEYRIYSVCKKIEIVYFLRKKASTDPEAVYVSFPFEVENGRIYSDVPGGAIEAGKDQIPGSSNDWYTVQNFAAARNREMQAVICSPEIPLMQFGAINTGRYEAGATPQTTNMYSWPMNNYWTTNFNADQTGGLRWSYFITSKNDPSISFSTQFAWENRIPLLARVLPAGSKKTDVLQPASLLDIKSPDLLLVNMKPIEAINAVLLQIRETGGKQTVFDFTTSLLKAAKVIVCDALGDPLPGNPAPVFKPWENKFIKLTWE
jgi:hypothetical protein